MIDDHYRRMYGEPFDLDTFYLIPYFKEKITDLAVLHLKKSREMLEKRWNKKLILRYFCMMMFL